MKEMVTYMLCIGSLNNSVNAASAYSPIAILKCGCAFISWLEKRAYKKEVPSARGTPNAMGRKVKFIPFLVVSELPLLTRRSALRTPSRLRKRIVLRISSNWIAAAPKALGEARRNNAWFRMKVNRREKSCKAMSEDAEEKEDLRSGSSDVDAIVTVGDSG